jgi:hypothetical protein
MVTREEVLIVNDRHGWVSLWNGPVKAFNEVSADMLAGYKVVVLAPSSEDTCQQFFDWKRAGLLNNTRLILGTYGGRHVWSPENDALIDRWVVHARSERQVLNSDKLVYVPLCVMPPRQPYPPGDDGYLFMGGRKWREPEVGLAAMSRSGYPGRVITDRVPLGDFPGVEIKRERVPKKEYSDVMSRARLVLMPLKQTPASHGQVDVTTAITIGKPVLVTAGCACDDYVQHGVNGLLVQENSVEAWTDAIHEACERADEFAAGARDLAARYCTQRYPEYIWEVICDPNRYLVGPEFARSTAKWALKAMSAEVPAPPASGGHNARTAHQGMVRRASDLLRENRYQEALAELTPCFDGPLRRSALRLKMRILSRVDCANSEGVIRTIIAEGGDDAEARANLAAALWAQERQTEALVEARLAVKMDPAKVQWRRRLIGYLRSTNANEEAARVTEDGIAIERNASEPAATKQELA